jgi:copper-containing nitrite reductase
MAHREHFYSQYSAVLVLLMFGFVSAGAFGQEHAAHAVAAQHGSPVLDIVRDPADVPPPVGNRAPTTVKVELVTREVIGQLDPDTGATYRYWTFNGKVPGPMIRVRQGDMVELTLHNDASSHMVHSIDLHAAIGPGGGAALSQVMPGQSKTFSFQATTPGLFVYHCGTPMIADHMANGMYGLILVEPAGGLPHVDHEYYVMQGEIYTAAAMGKPGMQAFSDAKLMQETPEYFVFNGAVDALTKDHPMHAKAGETVRFFFGNAGPNATSSMHMVGEIFTKDYALGSLTSPPLNGVQTANVPPGGAAMLEVTTHMGGQFNMMDHAIVRMAKGLVATLDVSGPENASLMHAGPMEGATATEAVAGITAADAANEPGTEISAADLKTPVSADAMDMGAMAMPKSAAVPARLHRTAVTNSPKTLNGCLTLQSDGKVMFRPLNANLTYRLEGRALLFDANDHHIVHLGGYFGSIMATEDPRLPSFVAITVDSIAPNCSAKVTAADIRKVENQANPVPAQTGSVVEMGEMRFLQSTVVVDVGQAVVWKNTSGTIHNVVADSSKALVAADVHLPEGAHSFESDMLRPGQSFSYTFTVPGVYRYVCTLHEANGMRGEVIVRAAGETTVASAARH